MLYGGGEYAQGEVVSGRKYFYIKHFYHIIYYIKNDKHYMIRTQPRNGYFFLSFFNEWREYE
jgi:hypothetical protein